MEFRVVEYGDGYGKRWWRPEQRAWFRWKSFRRYTRLDFTEIVEFKTRGEAEEFLAEKIYDAMRAQRRVLLTHPITRDEVSALALKLCQKNNMRAEQPSPAKSAPVIMEGKVRKGGVNDPPTIPPPPPPKGQGRARRGRRKGKSNVS